MAAACAGADTNRIVWLDVFAVRQWPGNGADLDFRGVLAGCEAAIVAAAPVEGTLTEEHDEAELWQPGTRSEFLDSAEYAAAARVLPFCRLWCVVEIAVRDQGCCRQTVMHLLRPAAHLPHETALTNPRPDLDLNLDLNPNPNVSPHPIPEPEPELEPEPEPQAARKAGKPLVFSCGEVEVVSEDDDEEAEEGGGGSGVWVTRGESAVNMLQNCAELVDIEAAEAAVEGEAPGLESCGPGLQAGPAQHHPMQTSALTPPLGSSRRGQTSRAGDHRQRLLLFRVQQDSGSRAPGRQRGLGAERLRSRGNRPRRLTEKAFL